jgi:hypothetical protein
MNTTQAATQAATLIPRFVQTAAALGLSLVVTLATLGSLNGLATEQHAATVMAKAAAAAQQAQNASGTAARS